MIVVKDLKQINALSSAWKKKGLTVSLVPTMGCLHAGHLSLVRRAKKESDKAIVSIFVNPTQFGPGEDFDSYPRQLDSDSDLLKELDVDVVFAPNTEALYSGTYQTNVSVKTLAQGMCGADRPGHFDGVATVLTKLFNITNPDIAIFGEKDFQQLAIIRQLTDDLNFNIRIIGCPIIREEDGLAMSSRNKYLHGDARVSALCLSRAIAVAKEFVAQNEKTPTDAVIKMAEDIVKKSNGELEYAVVVNESTLLPDQFVNEKSVFALSVKIDKSIRLIDNSKLF